MNKFIFLENLFLKILGIILPWFIVFASPQFHIGYWGQVEGMIVYSYFLAALTSLLLIRIGYSKEKYRVLLAHPLILIPILVGMYSIVSSFFQNLPVLALYGSPQIGQGAFWYFSIAIFTAFYSYLIDSDKWKYILLFNLFIVVLVISIGSFYPVITGVEISFFGFNDWLALYYTSLFIFIYYVIGLKKNFPYFDIYSLILFFLLGPLFWIIDNNSAIALWLLIFLFWAMWLIVNKLKIIETKYIKFLLNPLFFTLIPISLSILMVVSSYIFWDGVTDQTDIITNELGHLATLVARGSIIRVLLDHLMDFKAIIFGYGWGSISELLISSFTPEVFYQINTGNRVHFHTHNELFEHFFSIGLIGAFLYILYIYYTFIFSFKNSNVLAFLWLLYFCISAFWFQWVSNMIIHALLVSLLVKSNDYIFDNNKIKDFLKSKISFSVFLILISFFLFYGSYIGYFTALKHNNSFSAEQLIKLAEKAEKGESCTLDIYDFGKGALQFSQKFNGYNNYYKDQVMLYGVLNESDYQVLNWYLCASDELIRSKSASIELINVHINVLSTISILPGNEGTLTRAYSKKYIDLWENKLNLLLSLAPKRIDQSTSLISFYLKNNNYEGVERICNKINKLGYYQGYCDLSLGAIYMERGSVKEGMFLIKRAYENGVLESEDVDKKTAKQLIEMLEKYDKINE
tara:strand:- start:27705 stop:29768 length:2064 start_codon:yes stop_codon:yes gene_type:complete